MIARLRLDVHAETIAVALGGSQTRRAKLWERFEPRRIDMRKLIRKLGPAEKLRACYEAGPTGYVVYWQLGGDWASSVRLRSAPPVPVKAGDPGKDRSAGC